MGAKFSKILQEIKTRQSELVLILAVVLISIIAFESGRMSAMSRHNKPLEIKYAPAVITGNEFPRKTSLKTNQSQPKLNLSNCFQKFNPLSFSLVFRSQKNKRGK